MPKSVIILGVFASLALCACGHKWDSTTSYPFHTSVDGTTNSKPADLSSVGCHFEVLKGTLKVKPHENIASKLEIADKPAAKKISQLKLYTLKCVRARTLGETFDQFDAIKSYYNLNDFQKTVNTLSKSHAKLTEQQYTQLSKSFGAYLKALESTEEIMLYWPSFVKQANASKYWVSDPHQFLDDLAQFEDAVSFHLQAAMGCQVGSQSLACAQPTTAQGRVFLVRDLVIEMAIIYNRLRLAHSSLTAEELKQNMAKFTIVTDLIKALTARPKPVPRTTDI